MDFDILQTGAGRLYYLVAFDTREAIDDGFGNIVAGDWQAQFRRHAEYIHMRGSETVMANRLQGFETMIMRIRTSPKDTDSRRITTDWQARDVRRGKAYNIKEARPDNSRAVIDLLVETGGATG